MGLLLQLTRSTLQSEDWKSTDVHAWARQRTAEPEFPAASGGARPQLPPMTDPLPGKWLQKHLHREKCDSRLLCELQMFMCAK